MSEPGGNGVSVLNLSDGFFSLTVEQIDQEIARLESNIEHARSQLSFIRTLRRAKEPAKRERTKPKGKKEKANA